jgi:CDP-diglyceride synthetase
MGSTIAAPPIANRIVRREIQPMPLVALLLLIWALFGCTVVVMMVYGTFEHVAMNDAVMAAVLATGTAFLASLASFLAWRRSRR